MKTTIKANLTTRLQELNGIIGNTETTEQNLGLKATALLNDMTKIWLEDETETKRDQKFVSESLKEFGEVNANKEGVVLGQNTTQKYSEYTTRILVDTGYMMAGYPTQFMAVMKKVDLANLSLADYLRLQKSLMKLGKFQNEEVSNMKFTEKNISTDGKKLFELVKSDSVVKSERELAEATKMTGHPAKILKKILSHKVLAYDTEAHYVESIDEVLNELKETLIHNYEEAKKAEEEAKEKEVLKKSSKKVQAVEA